MDLILGFGGWNLLYMMGFGFKFEFGIDIIVNYVIDNFFVVVMFFFILVYCFDMLVKGFVVV